MQRAWVSSREYRTAIETLRAIREGKGVSQRELARRLNKPPSFVNKIELLERRLDIVEFVAIARAIGVEPAELLRSVVKSMPGYDVS